MKTKDFIDDLYRDCNGSMSRSEILRRVNSAQNELFSDNVLEMRELDTFTVEKTPQQPTFLSLTLNSSGELGTQATYGINDAFSLGQTYGAINTTSYFRVVVPFTYSASTIYTDIADCCLPIQHIDWALESIHTEIYETGAAIVAGDTVWDPDSGTVFRALSSFTVGTDGVAADIESHALIRDFDEAAIITGSEPATGAAYPTYVELADLREVTQVGTLASDGTFQTTYTPRIAQSRNPGGPVRIYVDSDLPLDTELTVEGWRWPVQLNAESTAMEVPEVHQNGIVRTKVMLAAEEGSAGASSYWAQREPRDRKAWFDHINRDKRRPPTVRAITCNPLCG